MNSAPIPVQALFEAARRPEVVAAMREFHADLDAEVAERSPTCWNKGECCRFGEYGHRLYVTTLEVAYYLAVGAGAEIPAVDAEVCPHAVAGKCHARDRRPMGCRVFYCDPAAQGWQGPLTEEHLGRLRRLHIELGIPYFYADWLSVLRSLNGC